MRRTKNKKFVNRWALLIVVVILLIIAFYLYSKAHSPANKITKTIQASSPNKSSSTSPSKPQQNSAITTPTSEKVATPSNASNSSGTLTNPSGSFVSNHRPSLSNENSQKESSTCITIPGANCYIEFTNGDKVRTLPGKVADSSGVVVWNWDLANEGFSEGTWQIKATATLNGSSKSSSDLISMQVQP